MSVRVTQRIDFAPQATAGMIKTAIDAGLRHHRVHHLPRHFMQSAPTRYAPAYNPQGARTAAPKETLSQLLKKMTPHGREQWRRMYKISKKGAYSRAKAILHAEATGRGIDFRGLTQQELRSKVKLPLVHTGHLRDKVLKGTGRFTGPATRRRLVLDVPFYFNFSQPPGLNKRKALEAVTEDEQAAIAKVVDRELQRLLNQRARRKLTGLSP